MIRFYNVQQKEEFMSYLKSQNQINIKGRNIEFSDITNEEEGIYFAKINTNRKYIKKKQLEKVKKQENVKKEGLN